MSDEQTKVQFDPEVLDSLHEAIGDGINHIISTYVDDFPHNIETMRHALAQQEYETVGRIAHSLKSSSGNLGAMQLVALSLALEQMIRAGVKQDSEINPAIATIEEAFLQVKSRMLGYIR